MIRSYASEVGKSLFEGNWGYLAKRQPLEPLDDCFIDLRILDAVANVSDISSAFKGRLSMVGDKGPYLIASPRDAGRPYRIRFSWTGEFVENVDVSFAEEV